MARKKIKIELEDGEGGRYSLSLEGHVTKEKIIKVFEVMQLLDMEQAGDEEREASIGTRILSLLENRFPLGEFTSNQVLEAYEDSYNQPIKLSVVSTYLSRFSQRGMLSRNKGNRQWLYRRTPLRH